MQDEQKNPPDFPAPAHQAPLAPTSLTFGEELSLDDHTMKLGDVAPTPTPTPRRQRKPLPSRAVRPIPKSSRAHFVGELDFNRGDDRQRLGFASLLEHNAALCFIYRRDFWDIEEQLAALPFVLPNGKASAHHFDFRVTFKGGRRVCISVKPEKIAQTFGYRSMIACVKKAAIGNICDDVLTVTERNIHPIALHNAKLFHSARDPEPILDARINAALKAVDGPIRICDFLANMGLEGVGLRSVARAILLGQAALFSPQKITAQSMITRGEIA